MSDVAEAWSCPRCNATWVREVGTALDRWPDAVRTLQAAHGPRCSRRESGR